MNRICGKHLPFLLCIALLLNLCGCQKKPLDHPPFDEEAAAYLESLYGMAPEEVLAELGLSEEDYDEVAPTLFRIHKPITIAGKKFTKELDVSYNDSELAKVTGIRYVCMCENAEEVGEVAEAAYLALVEQYGEIKGHAFVTAGCLCGEGVFDEIRKAGEGIRKYQDNTWVEAWCVGEFSYARMFVRVWNKVEYFSVSLEYYPLPEEVQRIDPDFGNRFPFNAGLVYGPYLRGEVPENEYN